MTERVRCAVVGSGFAGSTYAEAIRYAPDAELVAIAGGRQAPELAARHGVPAFDSLDNALNTTPIDALLIASPNPFHAPQTLLAASLGKHVLVEKPMAMNVAECRAMVDACTRAGVVLMVGHHHRFRRNPIATKLLLDRGTIGRVDMAAMVQTEPDQTTWLTRPENGGYLLGSGVHGLDLLRWWLGDIHRVAALTGQYRAEHVENGSILLLDFASGAHASIQDSVIPGSVPPPGSGVVRFDVTLTGERGVLQVDMYGEVRSSTRDGWRVETSLPVWDGHYAFLRMEAYASQAREFVAAIREQRPPRVPATEGLAAVAIVEAAHRAAASGSWQTVEAAVTTIDLRSDTVTLPAPEMRAAMAAAELGDDVYGEDPTVKALEARAAALLGKEAALFVPSGTMGNLLATLSHTRPGDEIICGQCAHTYIAEAAGAARLAGVSTWPVPQERASIRPEDVAAGIHPADDEHYPRTALVWVEQPNRGWTMPLPTLAAIARVARDHGLPIHMDGARIFNASLALDVPAADLASHVDSVMFCVSKGLAAPVGSVLVGRADFIARARRNRKVVGGAMRQAGVLAATGLYALEHMVERLADDHRHAARLADGLRALGWTVDRQVVETNIFFAQPPAGLTGEQAARQLAARDVLVSSPYAGESLRLVTHYGIEAPDVERALHAFASLSANARTASA